MNVSCQSCGRDVDHASPGCAEHARREAEGIHRAHLASGGSAEHCPVCVRPVAANRAGRRQGMGAEIARLRDEAAARVRAEERAGLCAELARVTGERDAANERLCVHLEQVSTMLDVNASFTDNLTAELSTMTGEVKRLRVALAEAHAIIEGRTVAPTNAEIAAHHAAGGSWLALRCGAAMWWSVEVMRFRDMTISLGLSATWLALDSSGRPCAWPVVGGAT